jgi:ceramide synthetase
VTGFFVMQDEPWFPRVLGGKGDVVKAFQVLHLAPSFAFKMYYLLQLGYHLHSLFYMIAFSPLRNDFLEMFLHHVATILLIMCSFLSNYMAIGALIVFTHDIGDVTGCKINLFSI